MLPELTGTFCRNERTWGRFKLRSVSQLFCHSEEREIMPTDKQPFDGFFFFCHWNFSQKYVGVWKFSLEELLLTRFLGLSSRCPCWESQKKPCWLLGKLFPLLQLLRFIQTSQYYFCLDGKDSAASWLRELLRDWDQRSWPVLLAVSLVHRTSFAIRAASGELIQDIFWR